MTERRRHKASSTPAHGPTSVKGSSITAKAKATPAVVDARSGEKKNREANPTSNSPSPPWLRARTPTRRRSCRSFTKIFIAAMGRTSEPVTGKSLTDDDQHQISGARLWPTESKRRVGRRESSRNSQPTLLKQFIDLPLEIGRASCREREYME